MADAAYPLKFQLEVEVLGPPTKDRFGNESPGKPIWKTIDVFGWSVSRTEVDRGDSILRTTDVLSVYATEPLTAAQKVRLPDADPDDFSDVWIPLGNAMDYNNNPFWAPGLYQLDCERVTG